MHALRLLRAALTWPTAAWIVAALAGRWVPPFDSLRILLPHACALLFVLGLTYGGRWRLGVVSLAALGAAPIALLALPGEVHGTPAVRLLQHNLLYVNPALDLPDRLEDVDIATLQEVEGALPTLDKLGPEWATVGCSGDDVRGTYVLSRLPDLGAGCLDGGAAWMRVAAAGGDITVVSLHLHWPWPAGGDRQERQVEALTEEIGALPGPVIVAGDFNQMPWSAAVARLAASAGGEVAPGLRATFVKRDGKVRLPIDHVLIPDGWSADLRTAGTHRSDHRAVAATIARP